MEVLEISQLQLTGCTFPIYCSESASCDDCTELKIIDVKLFRLNQHRWKAVLSKRRYLRLQERRSLILSRINARRDPMAAKLPPEIACQVFDAYIGLHPAQEIDLWPLSNDMHRGKPIYFETFQPSAHLRLGAVCRQWRSIAWGYSPLWNTLHVNITTKHYVHDPQIILEWLERSKDLPLDIRAVPSQSVRGPGIRLGMDITILTAIRPYVCRWRSVDLLISEDSMAVDLADVQFLSREHPSRLRHLSLYGLNYHIYPPINFLSYARHLANLAHLHLDGMSMSSAWVLIRLVASIEAPITHLSFSYTTFYDHPSWASQSVIHLPMLSSLSLQEGVSPLSANLLFSSLTTPALQSLAWSHLEYGLGSYLDFDIFYSFIARSRCSIHALYIRNLQYLNEENTIGLFTVVPNLLDLFVSTNSEYSLKRLLNLLSYRNFITSETPLLPRLRRLFVNGGCEADEYVWSSIVGVFVEDRDPHPGQKMPTPARSGLQMTISLAGPVTIDRDHLASLVRLWKEHGIFCVLQETRNQRSHNIFDLACSKLPSITEDGFFDSLKIMSTLSF